MKRKIDKSVLNSYLKLLMESLEKNEIISEDTARYLFYANTIECLEIKGHNLHRVQQEIIYTDDKLGLNRHKRLLKESANHQIIELDSFFELGKDDKDKYAIEFKFHRKLAKSGNSKKGTTTNYAGQALNDLNRLSLIKKSINRYFVYIVDDKMINYDKNGRTLYKKLLSKEIDETCTIEKSIINNQPKTTIKKAYDSFKSERIPKYKVRTIYKYGFCAKSHNYRLYVFKIV